MKPQEMDFRRLADDLLVLSLCAPLDEQRDSFYRSYRLVRSWAEQVEKPLAKATVGGV
jgi:hypothetical protein